MTAIALVPAPAPVLVQIERLGAELERPDLDVVELMDIHDRVVVVQSYIREANLSYEAAFAAAERRLHCERKVGQALNDLIASSPHWESHACSRRQYLPRGYRERLGVSGSQASRWRQLARLPDEVVDESLRTARAARRECPSTSAMVRLARALEVGRTRAGKPALSTAAKLRRILDLARQIKHVRGSQEHQLLREVVRIAERWQRALAPAEPREVQCLLCAREQPVSGAPARCQCGGAWVIA